MQNLKKFIVTASLLSGALVLSGCGSDSTSTAYTTGSDGEATAPARAYENTTFRLNAAPFEVVAPAPRVIGAVGGTRIASGSRDFTIVDGAGNPVVYNGPVRVSWVQNGRVVMAEHIRGFLRAEEPTVPEERPLQRTYDIRNGTGSVPFEFSIVPTGKLGEMSLNLQLVDENDAPLSNVFTLVNVYAVPNHVAEVSFLEQPSLVNAADPTVAKMKVALTANYDANGDGTITTNPLFVDRGSNIRLTETGPGTSTETIPTLPASGLSTVDFTDITVNTAGAYTFTVRYDLGEGEIGQINSVPSAPINLEVAP